MSKRIRSSNVQLGESFIIGQNENQFQNSLPLYNEIDLTKTPEELLQEASQKANHILEKANTESAQIIEKTNAEVQKQLEELELLKQQTLNLAKEEGEKSGYEIFCEKSKQQIDSMNTLISSSFKVKKEIISSSEKEILELSIMIAEKIIREELKIKPEIILEIIKAAISELKDKEEIKITVNPEVTKQLYSFTDELKNSINGLKTIKILEDTTIPMNSAIVESLESRIDARIDTQIAEITKNLMQKYYADPVLNEIPEEIEIRIEEPPKES